MKKVYMTPVVSIAKFDFEDIITASGETPTPENSVLTNGRQVATFAEDNDSVVANIWS